LTNLTATATAVRDIESTDLPNGVRVITEVMQHVRSVSVGVWVGTGSRRELPEQNGITHFIEHMLFKGTSNRSAVEIARSVDSIGGNLDAFTAKELVCYNTKVLDEHLSQAFDVLADLVLHPLFREEDIAKEKGVILEELKMEEDNPDSSSTRFSRPISGKITHSASRSWAPRTPLSASTAMLSTATIALSICPPIR